LPWPPFSTHLRDHTGGSSKDECLRFSSVFGYFDDYTKEYEEEHGDERVDSCNNNSEFTSLQLENLRLGGLSPVTPAEVFLLTSLSRIDLNVDNISMPFGSMWPSVDVEFPSLTFLSFFANDLHSTLPSIWAHQLVNLELIRLYDNALTGPIPSELMQLTSMTSLNIQYSYLTGSLPTQLGLMIDLLELAFHNNLLSGPIPTEIGLLTSLELLDVDSNQRTGTIPSEIGSTSLQTLSLANNLIHVLETW
jgi:Leucine-rich repeat (LRR) protein